MLPDSVWSSTTVRTSSEVQKLLIQVDCCEWAIAWLNTTASGGSEICLKVAVPTLFCPCCPNVHSLVWNIDHFLLRGRKGLKILEKTDLWVTKDWTQIYCPLGAERRVFMISGQIILEKSKWSVKLQVGEEEVMKKCICWDWKNNYHIQSQSGY